MWIKQQAYPILKKEEKNQNIYSNKFVSFLYRESYLGLKNYGSFLQEQNKSLKTILYICNVVIKRLNFPKIDNSSDLMG